MSWKDEKEVAATNHSRSFRSRVSSSEAKNQSWAGLKRLLVLRYLSSWTMLDTIYIARHGFRMAWRGNELNLSPTGRPRDPVLTAHGIDQVERLGDYFEGLPEDKRPQMIISSPYYRCVQTSGPTAKRLRQPIHIEPGETCPRDGIAVQQQQADLRCFPS